MAYFENADLGDPASQSALGWLSGLASGFSQAAMPSRAPIPFGAALGGAFSQANAGAMEGARNAQGYQKGNLELQQGNLGMAQALAGINYYRQRAGMPPISLDDLKPGKKLNLFARPKAPDAPKVAAPSDSSTTNFMPQPVARSELPAIGSGSMFGSPDDTIPSIRSTESGGNLTAVSDKGARGPMQLMPGTQGQPGYGVRPAADDSPAENDREGGDYYKAMVQRYNGNQTRALVAYNMGPGATDKWIAGGADPKKLPKDVKQYIGNVALGVSPMSAPRFQGDGAAQQPAPAQQPTQEDNFNPFDAVDQIGQFNPTAAMTLQEKIMAPTNMRAGSENSMIGMDGKMHVLGRNPNLGKDLEEDGRGGARVIPGALDAEAALEGATTRAKEGAELPFDMTREQWKALQGLRQHMGEAGFNNWLATGGLGLGNQDGSTRMPPNSGAPAAAPATAAATAMPGAAAAPAPAPEAPVPVMHGNTGGVKSNIPSVSEAAPINPSDMYLKDRMKHWADQEDNWYDALPSNATGEQRALAIADALKKTESGSWAEEKAGVKADLKAIGVDIGDETLGDPAEVQKVLKDNFSSTLAQIRAFTSRPAAVEVQLASKNFANPDLQPAANLAIISQTVGSLRWERSLMNDWAKAKEMGWKDPQDFMRAWIQKNPMQTYIDATAKEIGPLKGMSDKGKSVLPPAAMKQLKPGVVTHFKNKQSWTLGPDNQPQRVN